MLVLAGLSPVFFRGTYRFLEDHVQFFYKGQNTTIIGKIFSKIFNWHLTIPQRKGMWENQDVAVNQ